MPYLKLILNLLLPYYWSKGKGLAFALLFMVIALNIIGVMGIVKLNVWTAGFYNAIEGKDTAKLMLHVWSFFILLGWLIPASVSATLCKALMAFHWRRALTFHYADKMLQAERYYALSLGAGAIFRDTKNTTVTVMSKIIIINPFFIK